MTGLYFQFVIRVTQARSFEDLHFYFNGAIFAAIDSWVSLLAIAVCTKLFFKKIPNKFLETVYIFLLSMLLFLLLSMGGQIVMEVYVLNNDFYLYRYFADTFVKTSVHTFYALFTTRLIRIFSLIILMCSHLSYLVRM